MYELYLGLGSNMGDRLGNLKRARQLLQDKGIPIVKASKVYATEPVGHTDQAWFLNQVLVGRSNLMGRDILKITQSIERALGRNKSFKWGPRTLDIDILFYGECVVDSDKLTIPHPLVAERRFVLVPLVEVAPYLVHPVLQKTMVDLLSVCPDTSIVRPHGIIR